VDERLAIWNCRVLTPLSRRVRAMMLRFVELLTISSISENVSSVWAVVEWELQALFYQRRLI
jgi:hypothetical protein